MAQETKKITDMQTLRAIAHPARLQLYEALATMGPATATQLSQVVPAAPGSLSYHLRQLARYGYIEEAPDLGQDGRERWWRAIPGGVRWSAADFPDSPAAREAMAAAHAVLTARHVERLREWQDHGTGQWGSEWAGAAYSTDTVLYLDAEELRRLGAELDEVLKKWSEHSRATRTESRGGDGAPGRAEVFLFAHAFPFVDKPVMGRT
ncbi:ArsR family transcriptional regulator [Micromonospora sp. KC606]|uniref:ArsR/SmtB family transcription factor n=1 Tax=Micromonospora sp. KC606 TaxID=2530379 RepID=UPI001048C2A0|nr:helix-turn-helix domain-containing protein [Micromonospora sp. KC606]TDC85045.1 ArsR family transcriptional regulator [Micromonospora sp. KC606]